MSNILRERIENEGCRASFSFSGGVVRVRTGRDSGGRRKLAGASSSVVREVCKGTGLGLSVVYSMLRTSRGGILVDSEPGLGACFEVYLPEVGDGMRSA